MDKAALVSSAASLGISLKEDQLAAFQEFEDAFYEANANMNLTRIPKEEAWLRHFLDSLLFVDLIDKEARLLDIGCGPGFPSWPISVVRQDVDITGLDSSGKMLGFLRQHLLPNLHVIEGRAEEIGLAEQFDFVTGRALAPFAMQMELSAHFVKDGGIFVPMRTLNDQDSIAQFNASRLGLELERVEQRVLPVLDATRLFPVYRKVKKTPTKYPRTWAEIKRKPLA